MRAFRFLVAIIATGILPAVAGAEGVTWVGTAGGGNGWQWEQAANWEDESGNPKVPGADDRAKLVDAGTVTISTDVTIDSIEIVQDEDDCILIIEAGASLTLENDDVQACSGPGPHPNCPQYDHHHIDGRIQLLDNGVTGGTIQFVNADLHVLHGEGSFASITGFGPLCALLIESGTVLRNELDPDSFGTPLGGIRGSMVIDGTDHHGGGTFRNWGTVRTFPDDEMTFASVSLDDTSGALWWNESCSGFMRFEQSADLSGDFVSGVAGANTGAYWDFQGLIRTCGTLYLHGCDFGGQVGGSGGFEYASFNGGLHGCSNPGSSGGSGCANFEVTSLSAPTCN